MPKNFKAGQVETSRLVASGSGEVEAQVLIVSSSDVDSNGNLTSTFKTNSGIGPDVFLYVSGTVDGKIDGDPRSVSVFGGDVVISGTMYSEKSVVQVNENYTGSLLVSGNLEVIGQSLFGRSGEGADVTFHGGNSNAVGLKWDADGAEYGNLTLGASNYGIDFQVWGETAARYVFWDQSIDTLSVQGSFIQSNGSFTLGQQLNVGGRLSVTGSVFIQEQINIAGNTSLTGAVYVGTQGFTVAGGASSIGGTLAVGESGAGQNVTFYGGNASAVGLQWDEDGGTNGVLFLGQDGAGVGFQAFGNESGKYMQWIGPGSELAIHGGFLHYNGYAIFGQQLNVWERLSVTGSIFTQEQVNVAGNASITGSTYLGNQVHVAGRANVTGTLAVGIPGTGAYTYLYGADADSVGLAWSPIGQGTLTLGADDYGTSFKAFGDTSGKYMQWNPASDILKVVGQFTHEGGTATFNSQINVVGISSLTGSVFIAGPYQLNVGGLTSLSGNLVVGQEGAGENVTFYGGNASAVGLFWDEDYNTNGKLNLGQNDHGVDFQVYGNTSSRYMSWYASSDMLRVYGNIDHHLGQVTFGQQLNVTDRLSVTASLFVGKDDGTAGDVTFYGDNSGIGMVWDGTATERGSLTLGTNGNGVDFLAYGEQVGDLMFWDQSDSTLILVGNQSITGLTSLTGSISVSASTMLSGGLFLKSVSEPRVQASNESVLYSNGGELYFKNAGQSAQLLDLSAGTPPVGWMSGSDGGTADTHAVNWISTTGSLAVTGTLLVGQTGNGSDVIFYGGDSSAIGMQWDENGGGGPGALILGADDYGVDFKAFGATAGRYVNWDQSLDLLLVHGGIYQGNGPVTFSQQINVQGISSLTGSVFAGAQLNVTERLSVTGALHVGTAGGATGGATFHSRNATTVGMVWDNSLPLTADGANYRGSLTLGADGYGVDLKAFGETASKYLHWDGSDDKLDVTGQVGVTGRTSITGSFLASSGVNLREDTFLIPATGDKRVLILSGGAVLSPNESNFNDVTFFVSGSALTRGTSIRGTALFGGDVAVSGATYFSVLPGPPDTPTTDSVALYAKDTGGTTKLFYKDDAGTEIEIGSGGGGSGPGDASAAYVVMSATGSLNNERVLTAGTGITMADTGAGGTATLSVNDSKFAALSGSQFSGNVGITGSIGITTTSTFAGTATFNSSMTANSILPAADSTYDLGSAAARWANVYTGDLHLRNDKGNWTIQEDADKLIVINNLTGKRYKMALEPLEDDE